MDQFIVSARKYRPTTFEDVVGQKHVAETLMHEINNNKLAQAFLFTGPRGVGKTTCARILAKVINTTESTDPNQDFAFNIFEMDAASNSSVEDIRNLIDQVRIPPQVGKYKVYIIDEVHMLSTSAFNAFLKTLEEPPSYAIFILATTEKHKILPTILSRCQVFHFNRIETIDMVNHLKGIAQKEGIEADEDSLHLIARKADGGLRDALSMFDQLVSFGGGKIQYDTAVEILSVLDTEVFFELVQFLLSGDVANSLLLYDKIIKKGFDGSIFVGGLASHFRNLAVSKDTQTERLLDVSATFKIKYLEQSKQCTFSFILNGLNLVNEADEKYRNSRNPRLLIELTLMKLANLNAMIQTVPIWNDIKKNFEAHLGSAPKANAFKGVPTIIEEKSDLHQKKVPTVQTVPNQNGNNPLAASQTVASEMEVQSAENASAVSNKPITVEPTSKPIAPENKGAGTGVKLSSFEEFKRKKAAQQSVDPNAIITGDSENLNSMPNSDEINPELVEQAVVISDMPFYEARATQKTTDIQLVWQNFIATQSPRVATSLKLVTYSMDEDGILKVTIGSKAMEGLMEEIRIPLLQFIHKNYANPVKGMEVELGVVEQGERRPYTDKEKLDFLIKKHPDLAKTIEDLQLRLP